MWPALIFGRQFPRVCIRELCTFDPCDIRRKKDEVNGDRESIILTLFSRWAISRVRRRPFRPQTRHPRDLMTPDREDAASS